MHNKLAAIVFVLFYFTCTLRVNTQITIHKAIQDVSDVVVQDMFSSPATSRIYAYSAIAAYEAIRPRNEHYRPLHDILPSIPEPVVLSDTTAIDFEIAGILSCYYTAQAFVFSEMVLQEKIISVVENYKPKTLNKNIDATIQYAQTVAQKIINWSRSDNFIATRPLPPYHPLNKENTWRPTDTISSAAIEPHWGKLHMMVVDSGSSLFTKYIPEVSANNFEVLNKDAELTYILSGKLTEEQKQIARFWEDNTYSVTYVGHMQYAQKQASPAGHWMKIAGIVMQQQQINNLQAAYIYALNAIVLYDSYIVCWRLKYNSHLLRPVTFINQHTDPAWRPYLPTSFSPEYPSEQALISAASSKILTYCIGDNLGYTDSIQRNEETLIRHFESFEKAANEALVSQLYSGGQFHTTLLNSVLIGQEIAGTVLLKFR